MWQVAWRFLPSSAVSLTLPSRRDLPRLYSTAAPWEVFCILPGNCYSHPSLSWSAGFLQLVLSCLPWAPGIKSLVWDSVGAPCVCQPDSAPGASSTWGPLGVNHHMAERLVSHPQTPGLSQDQPFPQIGVPRSVAAAPSLHRVLKPQSPRCHPRCP